MLTALPHSFYFEAICLAAFPVPAGKPASQSAKQHHFDAKAAKIFRIYLMESINPQ
jgi:hypothetical protein